MHRRRRNRVENYFTEYKFAAILSAALSRVQVFPPFVVRKRMPLPPAAQASSWWSLLKLKLYPLLQIVLSIKIVYYNGHYCIVLQTLQSTVSNYVQLLTNKFMFTIHCIIAYNVIWLSAFHTQVRWTAKNAPSVRYHTHKELEF